MRTITPEEALFDISHESVWFVNVKLEYAEAKKEAIMAQRNYKALKVENTVLF